MVHALYLYLARSLGLFALARMLTCKRLRILGYHGIWFSKGHFGDYLFMSPDKFQARMDWLSKSRYPVISLQKAIDGLFGPGLPPCATVITVDDGWYGTYRCMLPALEKNSLPATLYVYTEAVDSQAVLPNILLPALVHLTDKNELSVNSPSRNEVVRYDLSSPSAKQNSTREILTEFRKVKGNRELVETFCQAVASKLGFDYDKIVRERQFAFMSYEEIADADRRGLDIQLHTHTHGLNPDSPSDVINEVVLNRDKLRPHVSSSLRHFCYPSGVHSEEMYPYLKKVGVESSTTVDIGLAGPESGRFALKRILDGQRTSQINFEAEMSGFNDLIRDARAVLTGWLRA